jgi:chorismate mutase/prephenate dehydratase
MDDDLLAKLSPLRDRIDQIDAQILDLLNQRAQTAQAVGDLKHAHHAQGPVLRPEREAQVIRQLQDKNRGPIPREAIASIWTEVMSACRGLEQSLTVAYLGPEGSFSEQAAFEHFGHSVTPLPCPSFDEVFRAVQAGGAQVGMVPVENSTEGAVNRTLDLLRESNVKIIGEHSILIRHCLMTQTGTIQNVTKIMAHPQALAQCQAWLGIHYPGLLREAVASNAEAARLASLDSSIAAIASDTAAHTWGLGIIAQGIQDDPHNRTRFLAIGQIETLPSGKDKTSLILAVPNEAGAVHNMLEPFSENGVSMTRFESRPARTGDWEYYFYVDIEGHQKDVAVKRALAELEEQCAYFKILGSYPSQ